MKIFKCYASKRRNKRRKNCEETRWRSQSAPVWPLAKSRLDAKISLVPKHQLIVPSTLLAPATQPKKTKPQRYIRSDHCHTSNFFQNSSIMIIKICFKELKCYFFNINIMNNTHTHTRCMQTFSERNLNLLLRSWWSQKSITEFRLLVNVGLKIAGPMTICALTKDVNACRVLWLPYWSVCLLFPKTKII